MRRSLVLLLALLLSQAAQAAAQNPVVAPYSKVRTTIGGVKREFTLVELRADSVVLLDRVQRQSRLALSDLDSLHVSTGGRSAFERFFRGAGTGGLLFGAVGILAGLIDGDDPPSEFLSFSAEEKAVAGFVFLGGLGAVIGGLIGLGGDSQRWVAVPIR